MEGCREEMCLNCRKKTDQYAKYRMLFPEEQDAVYRQMRKGPELYTPSTPLTDLQIAWECSECHCINPHDIENIADAHIAHFFQRCF